MSAPSDQQTERLCRFFNILLKAELRTNSKKYFKNEDLKKKTNKKLDADLNKSRATDCTLSDV